MDMASSGFEPKFINTVIKHSHAGMAVCLSPVSSITNEERNVTHNHSCMGMLYLFINVYIYHGNF